MVNKLSRCPLVRYPGTILLTTLIITNMDDYNLELYDRIRDVPENATKPIAAGRLKGKTDINPMWRIKQ